MSACRENQGLADLKDPVPGCDFEQLALPSVAFLVQQGSAVQNLTVEPDERLKLIDAGDYNQDGRSDLLFSFFGYNHDGYSVLDGATGQFLTFSWSYH